jgi:hypothetical protein
MLIRLGFFMGDNLNRANDNLDLRSLMPKLRRLVKRYGVRRNKHIALHVNEKLKELEASARRAMQDSPPYVGWGWKVPPNFLILDYLGNQFTGMKYVHVIRHGLDMAFSSNQRQLDLWGFFFGIDVETLPRPQAALKYWIEANKFALQLGNKHLQERFYLLCFDRLCTEPEQATKDLCQFLALDQAPIEDVVGLIQKPASLGRYKQANLDVFDERDLQEVKRFGFTIQ